MSDKTALGDRMKFYESSFINERLMPQLPAFARIDGKGFHNYTKGLERPYDVSFSKTMIEVTKMLVEDTQATVGYTQSDEITLSWYKEDFKSQIFFDGKVQKMISILASMTTAYFAEVALGKLPQKEAQYAFFDCRVWNVPTLWEASNVFLWREQDATRNSIQMAGRSVYSHKECNNKNMGQLQEMLFQKGINWNDYPDFFKRGTYIFSHKKLETIDQVSDAGWEQFTKIRRELTESKLPILSTIENRPEVLYLGAEPIIKQIK